jgi:glycerol-3-phosphate acyltransferase PlsY
MELSSALRQGAVIAASYLCGGVSTGYYLVKWRTGIDIREQGSGSSGAHNVGRLLGRSGYAVTAIGDIAKGMAITAAAQRVDRESSPGGLAAVAAVAGHIWPVQMGFRGGRGLTVAFGAVIVIAPAIAVRSALVAACLLPIVRKPSTAVLAATALAPAQATLNEVPTPVFRSIAMMAAMVLFGHRHYLRSLVRETGAR